MDWDIKDTVILGGWLLTICGWIVQYRFSIRSKKKDSIVQVINELREISKDHINDIFERLENINSFKNNPPIPGQPRVHVAYLSSPNPSKLIEDIDLVILRNSHVLGPLKRWKIKSTANKIAEFSERIYNLKKWDKETHNKYRKQFYKYLNSIKQFD